jgi:hypothetical protein
MVRLHQNDRFSPCKSDLFPLAVVSNCKTPAEVGSNCKTPDAGPVCSGFELRLDIRTNHGFSQWQQAQSWIFVAAHLECNCTSHLVG